MNDQEFLQEFQQLEVWLTSLNQGEADVSLSELILHLERKQILPSLIIKAIRNDLKRRNQLMHPSPNI